MLTAMAGCASSSGHQGATGALSITQMTTAIGGVSPEEQKLSYSITLLNDSANEVVIKTLQPMLPEQFAKRSLAGSAVVAVEKTIGPQGSLTVSGDVSFDAKGASKEEIVSWGPAILGAKIGSEVELKASWAR